MTMIANGQEGQEDQSDTLNSFNPVTSTFKFWSPISNLPAFSSIIPAYIDLDEFIDMVILSDGLQVNWISNLRGVGYETTYYSLSSSLSTTSGIIMNIQNNNSSDIVFQTSDKSRLMVALNPYKVNNNNNNNHMDAVQYLWQEVLLFDANTLSNNMNICSFMDASGKLTSSSNPSLLVSLCDQNNQTNSVVYLLTSMSNSNNNNNNSQVKFTNSLIYSSNTPSPITFIFIDDVDNDQLVEIGFLLNNQLYALSYSNQQQLINLRLISDNSFSNENGNNTIQYIPKNMQLYPFANNNVPDLIYIRPSDQHLCVLVNTWGSTSSQNSTPTWESVEIPREELMLSYDKAQTEVQDFVLYKTNHVNQSLDFIVLTKNQMRYYINTNNYTLLLDSSMKTVPIYIYQDIEMNLMVWNSSLNNKQLYYLQSNNISSFILFDDENGTVSWIEENIINLQNAGWAPNFWIYIMAYCCIMSLLAGLMNEVVLTRIGYHRDAALLEMANNNIKSPSKNPPRRTTL